MHKTILIMMYTFKFILNKINFLMKSIYDDILNYVKIHYVGYITVV